MNQIIDNTKHNNCNKNIKDFNDNMQSNNLSKIKNPLNIKKYKLQFWFSIFIFVITISLLISNIYSYSKKEDVSKNLLNSIKITRLYADDQNYTISGTETTQDVEESNILENSQENSETEPFVIGIIQIEKINVNYPILSSTSRELLKISLCRCAGPMPNEVGNLCIAGHNLVDYKLFSRLNELNLKDTVKIYDLKGNMCEYEIYKKYEVVPTDLSCLDQNTNNSKIITLLTCNNVNGKRLIVVGKEK